MFFQPEHRYKNTQIIQLRSSKLVIQPNEMSQCMRLENKRKITVADSTNCKQKWEQIRFSEAKTEYVFVFQQAKHTTEMKNGDLETKRLKGL
jgi:hypothetical protein